MEKIEASKGQSAPEPESIIGHRLLGKTVVAVCTATDKVIYPSEKDAKHEINKIKSYMQGGKKPERAYECEKCGGWHLTSIPHEQWEK